MEQMNVPLFESTWGIKDEERMENNNFVLLCLSSIGLHKKIKQMLLDF